MLRPGNVHSAEEWDELLLPEIERNQAAVEEVASRVDVVLSIPETDEPLKGPGRKSAVCISANERWETDN